MISQLMDFLFPITEELIVDHDYDDLYAAYVSLRQSGMSVEEVLVAISKMEVKFAQSENRTDFDEVVEPPSLFSWRDPA